MKHSIGGIVALPVLVVVILSLAASTDCTFCAYKDFEEASLGGRYMYFCIQVSDYLAKLNAARTNLVGVILSYSEIPVLKNSSFVRSSDTLKLITLYKIGLNEIEDEAFRGLDNLNTLNIVGTELEVVKGVWFRDLKKLKIVSLQWNRIHTIEGSFFSNVGYLQSLHITGNNLTCIPNAEYEQFHVGKLGIQHNPFTRPCQRWLKNVLPRGNLSIADIWNVRPNIDDPVGYLPDIPIESITDLCSFLTSHPTPYMRCATLREFTPE